jgi:glutathione S-transferase
MPHLTALVTLLAIVFYFYTALNVGFSRPRLGVPAPATTGNPEFERLFRVQMNTLEWMPIFLPLLWLCAFYVGDVWAAALGVVWIVGRVMYLLGYAAAAEKRGPGFGVQALACAALLVADLVAIVLRLIHGA